MAMKKISVDNQPCHLVSPSATTPLLSLQTSSRRPAVLRPTTVATSSSSHSKTGSPSNRVNSNATLSYVPQATTGLPGSSCCAGQNWGSISFMAIRRPTGRFMFSQTTSKGAILKHFRRRTSPSGYQERQGVRLRHRVASTRRPPLRDRLHPCSVGMIAVVPAESLPRRCTSQGRTNWCLKMQAWSHSRGYTSRVARNPLTDLVTPC